LSEHPGGELAILTSAGKDTSEVFNMRHPPDVTDKYAPDAVIGILGVTSPHVAHGGGGAAAATAPVSKYMGSGLASNGPGATWMARAIGTLRAWRINLAPFSPRSNSAVLAGSSSCQLVNDEETVGLCVH
jgi:hypothetical protein